MMRYDEIEMRDAVVVGCREEGLTLEEGGEGFVYQSLDLKLPMLHNYPFPLWCIEAHGPPCLGNAERLQQKGEKAVCTRQSAMKAERVSTRGC